MTKKITKPKKSTRKKSSQTETKGASPSGFPIVGIGASAGGFEAFSLLLNNLPVDTGMAYVFIQHLHPSYKSALTELLSKSTRLPVIEITNNMTIEPNHIYVIPPNSVLEIFHSRLHLTNRQDHAQHLPIDYFFRSLADEQGAKAIGVILSGTASDGVLGLQAIKAKGGITFSQDEASAKYNGMPHNAIASGCVDFILSPSQIATELARISRHSYFQKESVESLQETTKADNSELSRIFILLRKLTGIDFTYYKLTTIQRRIKRRMLLNKIDTLPHYIKYLENHETELQNLYQDFLINVTEFFREPATFENLQVNILPTIISGSRSNNPIRVWIPGCSTGEEAYSFAMILIEYMEKHSLTTPVQIFATDIDELAVQKARMGIYPNSISEHVSPDRLARFFKQQDDGFQMQKSVRDICIFARQDVFKDPPFSKIDLISCRNLLIYLGPVLQKRILSIFHYALNRNGILFLGSAESIGDNTELFKLIDQKHKIYSKKSVISTLHNLDISPGHLPDTVTAKELISSKRPEGWNEQELYQTVDRLIIQHYAPAAVVVNDNMQILQFRGKTGRFLEPAPGQASLNILKMAREGLAIHLRKLLNKSIKEQTTVRHDNISFSTDNQNQHISIEVTPITHPSTTGSCYLIVFIDYCPPSAKIDSEITTQGLHKDIKDEHIAALTQELTATKEYLQSVIEQKEISNEELRSANEEIQSSNEELQSINEELETAKEELQSTNEELATVNEELEERNTQLGRLNDDHTNFVNSMNIAFITVNRDLTIRNFTPKTKDLLNIISSDIGRPITDINYKFHFPELYKLITEAIEQISIKECEFHDENGHRYSLRIRPYMTVDNRIDGAVVAIIDVNDIHSGQDTKEAETEGIKSVVSSIQIPLLIIDKDLRVLFASNLYYDTFKVMETDTIGYLVNRLGNGEWAIPDLRKKLLDIISIGASFDNYEVEHEFDHAGLLRVVISGRQIVLGTKHEPLAMMQIHVMPNNTDTH